MSLKPKLIDNIARDFIKEDAPTLATLEALDVEEWQWDRGYLLEEDEVETLYKRVVAILSETP